jgi:hypothetical protein
VTGDISGKEKYMSKAPSPLIQSKTIRLGLVGMVTENDHPYSWSAIFNGYDPREMAKRADPIISAYLGKQPKETLGIPNARVTHIWTDKMSDAAHVARASYIPHVVKRPEDVIGKVDAVLIPTDRGHEHVRRCRPFVEAGLPMFVDKPLVDNEPDLKVFTKWANRGAPVMSSSFMRYCKEFMPYRASTHELGKIRFVSITTPKSWERYGIHALEGIYPILGPGFISVRNTGTRDRNVVHLEHRCGTDIVVVASADLYGSSGVLQLCGTAGHVEVAMRDRFHAFKQQLRSFIEYLRTGVRPFPFSETQELMQVVIAGIRSRDDGGRKVRLSEIKVA